MAGRWSRAGPVGLHCCSPGQPHTDCDAGWSVYPMSFVRLYLHSHRVGRNILWSVTCECGVSSDAHGSQSRAMNEGKRHLAEAHPRQGYVFRTETDEMGGLLR